MSDDSAETKAPQRYSIRTVRDFFSVPESKRAHCLDDFEMWLQLMDSCTNLFAGVDGIRAERDEFVWIDDGKSDANVAFSIVSKRSEEPEASPCGTESKG